MKKNCLYLFVILLLCSCEKEIDLDYHQVEPLYTVEAMTTQEGTQVQICTTQDVSENSREGHYVEDAKVVISIKKDDFEDTLQYTRNGIYTSWLKGYVGYTYDLDIYIGDRHFTSSSTMPEAPVVKSFEFVWKEMLSQRYLLGDLRIEDTPDQNSYYFMHLYRNNIGYRWAVMTDAKNRNAELQQLFRCTTEKEMNQGDSDALKDGDKIRLEVRAIDKRAYDYLYSMQTMDNAGTNPIANFTGGCLGYYSACNTVTYDYTFRRSEVREEGE